MLSHPPLFLPKTVIALLSTEFIVILPKHPCIFYSKNSVIAFHLIHDKNKDLSKVSPTSLLPHYLHFLPPASSSPYFISLSSFIDHFRNILFHLPFLFSGIVSPQISLTYFRYHIYNFSFSLFCVLFPCCIFYQKT